jgi:aspartate/methionine/tyrosine aminotransferase
VNRSHGVFTSEDWRSTVIQLYSFSKSFAIPGHRTGALMANAGLIEQIAKILDCIQICAPRPAQAALPWAIEGLREWREGNRAEINRRIEVFRKAVEPLPEWRIESIGAFFAYLRHPFQNHTAHQVAERLAVERGVLCLPGSYFGPGQDNHLRVAFANVGADVLAGLTDRLRGFVV